LIKAPSSLESWLTQMRAGFNDHRDQSCCLKRLGPAIKNQLSQT